MVETVGLMTSRKQRDKKDHGQVLPVAPPSDSPSPARWHLREFPDPPRMVSKLWTYTLPCEAMGDLSYLTVAPSS